MSGAAIIEQGSVGRVAFARIAPNEDLVVSVERACLAHGFVNAFVRGALGSLVDACLVSRNGIYHHIKGPAVEILAVSGEVRASDDGSIRAVLNGIVADPDGNVFGGPFVAGLNPVCMTFEVTLEEWVPAA